jgi:hypothetical protein
VLQGINQGRLNGNTAQGGDDKRIVEKGEGYSSLKLDETIKTIATVSGIYPAFALRSRTVYP